MDIATKLDEVPKPIWIALMILGFMVYWPIGLLVLAYLIWGRRMGCWTHGRVGRWHNDGKDRFAGAGRWHGPASGNRAFDEYREETLRRLEQEQREFVEFLERLRFAKDRVEFDQFMADRRTRPQGPEPQPQA
ncbi:MAG TPA: DUF2852 domain-containing protein [Xanthobacteraceae bacterium]|jgi:hypothetical protein|nr:DUF2852 domain-containing protein [Xanthobacteraceae bacterium]